MAKHALLSASGAARWLVCTRSARLEEQFPAKSSTYADEGTTAHAFAELAAQYKLGGMNQLNYSIRQIELRQDPKHKPYYNEEMQEYVDAYADFVAAKLEECQETCPDAFAELEVRLDFHEWVPEGFGTGDCVIISDGRIEIIDFKYGKGHRVDATNNPQMMLYALGAIGCYEDLFEINEVCMTIYQPRLSGTQSSFEISVEDLLKWAEDVVKPKAKLAYAGKGEFCPTEEACLFCRAKKQCAARAKKNLDLFDESPDALLITPEKAGEILAKASDIESWLADLKDLVKSELMKGESVTGWKLVAGKSNRKYSDEAKAAAAMIEAGYKKEQIYDVTIKSIATLEKAFGKKKIGEILKGLIDKPEGAPTLASKDDKRPALQMKDRLLKDFDIPEEDA